MALQTQAPFHLEATVRVLQRRASNRVDRWDGERYQRLLPSAAGPVLIEVHNAGSIDAPALQLAWPLAPPGFDGTVLVPLVRRLLGLGVDPAVLEHCTRLQPRLHLLAASLRGMRPPRFPDLFESVANVIPFQQLSLDAGVAVVGRLVQRFGVSCPWQGQRYHAFPAAARVGRARICSLTACGLSARKAQALRELAVRIEAGDISERMIEGLDSTAALEQLIAQPGIGPWTAAVILLRGFGRLDVFPPGDVGAIGSLRRLLHLRSDASLERLVRRCGAQRGYLYFFGLAGRLLERSLIHPASGSEADEPRA